MRGVMADKLFEEAVYPRVGGGTMAPGRERRVAVSGGLSPRWRGNRDPFTAA